MRAFLSHSSKDKGFVEDVASGLRPGTFDLDSVTFDAGQLNAQAILSALTRTDLFCLFLSRDSVRSSYVEFETLLGVEFFAKGGINRFLVICLDDQSFEAASVNARYFNIVRKILTPDSAQRLIEGTLISAAISKSSAVHPFVGRQNELVELQNQISDYSKPPAKAIYASGNFGSGRHTLVKHFYQAQYPQVGKVFPMVHLDSIGGLEELYRKVLFALRPSIHPGQLRTSVQGFQIANDQGKRQLIADLIGSLLPANEATIFMDDGGMLGDSGALEAQLNDVVSLVGAKPHPPLILISNRAIQLKQRRKEQDIAYVAVRSLDRATSTSLMSRLLKDAGATCTREELDQLIDLSDEHPFNFYRIVEEIGEKSLAGFLANPGDFIEWKHRQSSEYLGRLTLSEAETWVLAILTYAPELDFEAISVALGLDNTAVSDAVSRLSNLHVIEPVRGNFMLAPALRIAIGKDERIRLPQQMQRSVVASLAQSLSLRLDEGTAPVSLVDAAILASIESQAQFSPLMVGFLLPSHYVMLARRHYDGGDYPEAIRLAKEALKGAGRLSASGLVVACRFLCLAAARLGDTNTFSEGISRLASTARSDYAKSNVAYLKGFEARMKGHLPEAEDFFREAYTLSPGNSSAAREIAAICLVRDKLEDAERFAREAHSRARQNPFFIDILISVLIRRYGNDPRHRAEREELFDLLSRTGEEEGRSFYTTRRAEFEHLHGDNREALRLIEEAIEKTANIFEPRRLHVEILLKQGNKTKAADELEWINKRINSRDPKERRYNYRAYLQTKANYLVELGAFNEARTIFNDAAVFTDNERANAVKEIDTTEAYYRSRK